MIVEVVAVGTELLLGQIVNTNAAFLGALLAEHGFDAHFQITVGDNLERLSGQIGRSLRRADAVILTGGLGPTPDDLTREALAQATGKPLRFDASYAEALAARFAALGRDMPENNLRQAEYPEGARMLANPNGTAPGLALQHQGTWIFAVPGVPAELEPMMRDQVLPRLHEARGQSEVLVSRVLRTWGRSESAVAETLHDLYVGSTNPSIAYLASAGEINVRISAKAKQRDAALALVAPLEAEIRNRLGSAVFGTEEETVEHAVLAACEARGWTLGTAESATGGMVAARLTRVPGSSRTFKGAVVAYAADLKSSLLGVDRETIAGKGQVSEAVAVAMAQGAAPMLGVDVVVAVSGSAGPDELEQPAGTMVMAVRTPEAVKALTLRLPGQREQVRGFATTAALHLTRLGVAGAWW